MTGVSPEQGLQQIVRPKDTSGSSLGAPHRAKQAGQPVTLGYNADHSGHAERGRHDSWIVWHVEGEA